MNTNNEIRTAGVIGSGTMGRGIAMAHANAGIPVVVVDSDAAALERGLAEIARTYESSVARGRLSAEEAGSRRSRITGALDIAALRDADIVTEAVFEDMDIKLGLVARLETVIASTAIVASNTSTLDIDRIAAAMRYPARFLGMHYFSPAHVMKLLEIVRGAKTAPEVVAKAVRLGEALGKVPVVVGVCFGFVGNRMLFARAAEAELTLLEGATPSQNDEAMTAFGFPMGQHAMMDLSGIDVEWRIRRPRGEVRPVSDRLYEMKRWGQKTGAGFYRYEKGDRTAIADPTVEAICRELGEAAGFRRRAFGPEELTARLLYPLVAEGARLLEEGIAASAADIDTIWRHGYGWPADKGGPMAWADDVGASVICAFLERLAEERGDAALRPPEILRRMARDGGRFHRPEEARS